MDDETLLRAAAEWIAGDPDPGTGAELQALVDAEDLDELRARLDGDLEFGTAGLRGIVGAGPRRMNRAVVIRTTAGLAAHLQDTVGDLGERVVVVGFDARPDSRRFAADVVGVFAAAGIHIELFVEPIPTPVVAWTAKDRDAAAAVVVTASHNPPAYNGYKVYAAGGAQIVPPEDDRIAERIAASPAATDVPRVQAPLGDRRVTALGSEVVAAYLEQLDTVRHPPRQPGGVRLVYTPLHGVGGSTLGRAFDRAGYDDLHVVPAQAEPDGGFPTVAFPNPEEPGALDLGLALARELDAHALLANDPDADRLAVAIREEGDFRALTGNQLGVLLADHLLRHDTGERRLVVNTVVSTPMLGAVAEAHGARWELTLTGFKWIWAAGRALEQQGWRFVLGFEEALGYSVGPVVRDKDGIGAALAFADLVAGLRESGSDVRGRLDELARTCGLWVSAQHSVARSGPWAADELGEAMTRARSVRIDSLAGLEVTDMTDHAAQGAERPPWLAATDLLEYHLGDRGRALVRPSGTEPKLKIYVDLRGHAGAGPSLRAAEERLSSQAADVGRELARSIGLS